MENKFNVIVLEARDRLGGRIHTVDGHDLGPSWIWPHQKNSLNLIDELGLEIFPQYDKGVALYDAPDGVQRFNQPPSAPSSRLRGGLKTLIDSLENKLRKTNIFKNAKVIELSEENNIINILTNDGSYEADYVLSTLPPRLSAQNIKYTPNLDVKDSSAMMSTNTWMGSSAKCVIEFEESFWRDMGLSGFVYSPIGPLGEIHDASTADSAALFGFVNSKVDTLEIKEKVKEQMQRLFGGKSELITNIYFVDWREEEFSSTQRDKAPPREHPQYGLSISHFDEKLFFIGTETSYDNGGYIEGALISAKNIVDTLVEIIGSKL